MRARPQIAPLSPTASLTAATKPGLFITRPRPRATALGVQPPPIYAYHSDATSLVVNQTRPVQQPEDRFPHLDSIRRTPRFEVGPHGVRIARQGTSGVHFGHGQIHFGGASGTHVRQRAGTHGGSFGGD